MQSTRALSDLMEFEHVIRVENGVATDRMPDGSRIGLYAPECIHDGFTHIGETVERHIERGTGWTLMEGYTGQYSYNGPVMHASEYIGGRMEQDILAQDGYYVALVCSVLGDDPDASEDEEPAGWAVAYRSLEGEV